VQIVNLDTPETLAVLTYGQPGSGKTTFLGSACDDERSYPMLHVDVSGNPETLTKRQSTTKPSTLGRKPYVLKLQKLKELNAIYDWFAKGQPDAHVMVDKMGCTPGYKALGLDGVTAIQRKSFAIVTGQELQPGDIPLKAEWPHYAAVLRQMLTIATAFLQELRSVHVLVSCLEHTEQRYLIPGEAKTVYTYFEPGLSGQAVTELPGEALAVLRFAHKSQVPSDIAKKLNAQYTIAQLSPSRLAYAKDQHHLGGTRIDDTTYMADPTVAKMLDALERKYQ
jgi:hypothetical protein